MQDLGLMWSQKSGLKTLATPEAASHQFKRNRQQSASMGRDRFTARRGRWNGVVRTRSFDWRSATAVFGRATTTAIGTVAPGSGAADGVLRRPLCRYVASD